MGQIIVVTITTIVLIFTKMFDYYQNKDLRDIKMMLDIQKGLKDTNYSGEKVSQMRKFTVAKIDDYIEKTNKHLSFKKKHPFINWIAGYVNFLLIGYLIIGFIFAAIFLLLSSIYPNEDFSKLRDSASALGLITVIIFGFYWITKNVTKAFKNRNLILKKSRSLKKLPRKI